MGATPVLNGGGRVLLMTLRHPTSTTAFAIPRVEVVIQLIACNRAIMLDGSLKYP